MSYTCTKIPLINIFILVNYFVLFHKRKWQPGSLWGPIGMPLDLGNFLHHHDHHRFGDFLHHFEHVWSCDPLPLCVETIWIYLVLVSSHRDLFILVYVAILVTVTIVSSSHFCSYHFYAKKMSWSLDIQITTYEQLMIKIINDPYIKKKLMWANVCF